MEATIHCPVCGGGGTRSWLEKEGYRHRYCPECQLGFLHPVPDADQLDAYYASLDSGLSSDCSWQTEPRHKCQLWRSMLKRVERRSGRGPLLDLGCGAGQFLRLAREEGWEDLVGIEVSERAATMARSAVDAPIHTGSWTEVNIDQGHFAGVALLDVLEHAPDPAALLRHVHRCLRPGGALMITVPNANGLSIRCFGNKSSVVIPPEHVAYFTKTSLARLLNREGFVVEWQSTCDVYLKDWLRFLPRGTGDGAPAPGEDVRRAEYARWYRRFTGNTALWCIGAVNVGLACTGLGDQLVCIARKP